MTSPYSGTVPVPSLGAAVTLVEGQSFAVSSANGDMDPERPQGVFVLDTRVLSRWELLLNGHRVEALQVVTHEPYHATFVGRGAPAPGQADTDLVVFRNRHVGQGMREHVAVTNHGLEPHPVRLELVADVDFADLFAVKIGQVHRQGGRRHDVTSRRLAFFARQGSVRKKSTVTFSRPADVELHTARWEAVLGPGQHLEVCLEVSVTIGSDHLPVLFSCRPEQGDPSPARRLRHWRAGLPDVEADHPGLVQAVARSGADLGALQIEDPEHPERTIVAAGAPWFMTVFGRDSLLTAWMTLLADTDLALGVLQTLARFQGSGTNPETDEEPGKILHEMRFGAASHLALGAGHVYFGSVDATPLFVILVDELRRWSPDGGWLAPLMPAVDRAMAWIEHVGDRDGDGYVEYQRGSERGLVNQGWKDSWDAVRHADGSLAEAPIALCEVQAYVYGAYTARARLADATGDTTTARRCRALAADLRTRFDRDFWLEEAGTYALGLDAAKRPIAAVTSNPGHCLWAGIAEPDKAALVAARLLRADLFSGFGVRTLASSMPAYNPVSYHNGSVWPHDNALAIAGLTRYGLLDEAHRILRAQLDVATAERGSLPELFAGFDRGEVPVPVPYPTSCRPQAWAAASPLLWLRSLLRFEPDAPAGRVRLSAALPHWLQRLHVARIGVGGQELTVHMEGDRLDVTDVGPLLVEKG